MNYTYKAQASKSKAQKHALYFYYAIGTASYVGIILTLSKVF